jgi:glycosyltransferase involved in cell wall biosynthesis
MSPPSLRILMTADVVGGVGRHATTLALALARRGCRVHLVLMGPQNGPEPIRTLAGVEAIEIESTDLALEWMDPEGKHLSRAVDRLAAIERRIRPDIVHLNSYREACGAWTVPVLVAAHSCVRSWWLGCRGSEPSEPRWEAYMRWVGAGLSAATLWIAPTAAFRDVIQSLYAPARRGRVIWNGIEPIGSGASKQPIILAAGRLWDEAKNVHALARVARRLDWPVKIAGSLSLDHSGNRGELADRLEMLGELTHAELVAWMRAAAVFAAPALYEPFGLAILEAATAGCALVLADIPTLRELWDGAAAFANPRDDDAIAGALERLCGDNGLRARLARAAVRRARRYSVSQMGERYRAAYDRLLAEIEPGRRFASPRCGPAEMVA